MGDLHLYLYRDEAPGWPANGRPRKCLQGRHFEAELVLLPGGHAVRFRSDRRTLAEFVLPEAPGSTPVEEVDLDASDVGGFFSNDRLLYRGNHRRETFDDDKAYQAAAEAVEQELASNGAEVLRDPSGGDTSPLVSVVSREHEVEVRALYRNPGARTLLRWTSVLGLKLKLRR